MQFSILLPNIFNYPFTYESNLNLSVGDFVEVPFFQKRLVLNGMNLKKKTKKILR